MHFILRILASSGWHFRCCDDILFPLPSGVISTLMSHNGQSRLVSLPGFVSLPRDLRYVALAFAPSKWGSLPSKSTQIEARCPSQPFSASASQSQCFCRAPRGTQRTEGHAPHISHPFKPYGLTCDPKPAMHHPVIQTIRYHNSKAGGHLQGSGRRPRSLQCYF